MTGPAHFVLDAEGLLSSRQSMRKMLSSFPTRGIEVIPGRLLLKPGTYRFVIWSGVGAKRSRRTARHSRKKDQALGSTNANGKKELPR